MHEKAARGQLPRWKWVLPPQGPLQAGWGGLDGAKSADGHRGHQVQAVTVARSNVVLRNMTYGSLAIR